MLAIRISGRRAPRPCASNSKLPMWAQTRMTPFPFPKARSKTSMFSGASTSRTRGEGSWALFRAVRRLAAVWRKTSRVRTEISSSLVVGPTAVRRLLRTMFQREEKRRPTTESPAPARQREGIAKKAPRRSKARKLEHSTPHWSRLSRPLFLLRLMVQRSFRSGAG